MIVPKAKPDEIYPLKPLTWWGLRKADGTRSATMACPNGHEATLTDHEIREDGTVMLPHIGEVLPSVVCPYEGCTFHDYVQLEGWEDATR